MPCSKKPLIKDFRNTNSLITNIKESLLNYEFILTEERERRGFQGVHLWTRDAT